METSKPFINVGLIELSYDMERSKFVNLLKDKANYVKYLDSQAYFEKPGTDVIKAQKLIATLRKELEIFFGFLHVSNQLKDSYECQLETTYDAYENELSGLRSQIQQIETIYSEAMETCYRLMKNLIKPKP